MGSKVLVFEEREKLEFPIVKTARTKKEKRTNIRTRIKSLALSASEMLLWKKFQ